MLGNIVLMGDQHDGVAFAVQFVEQRHDLGAGVAVQIAGRLVAEQDRRVRHQRARNRHALALATGQRSEEHTSELQSLMRISYAVFCLKKKTTKLETNYTSLLHHNITNHTL